MASRIKESGLEKELKPRSKHPKSFLLTCAQASYYEDKYGNRVKWSDQGSPAKLNKNLYDGLKTFQEINSVDEFQIFPVKGICIRENVLHESIESLPELTEDVGHFKKANTNVTISDIRVPPQNVDPSTSRKHLTAKYGATLVFPHPKQRLCPVASSSSEYPRFIATTGAITTPNYNTSNDRGDQATRDHRLGGIFLEVFDDTQFMMHFLTATKDGKFVHMGQQYDGNKRPQKIPTDALVLGDIHWGEHDPTTMRVNYEMIKKLQPKKLIIHDVFTGNSISHWNADKPLYRAQQFKRGELSLEDEIRATRQFLINISRRMGKNDIYVVHSNHDDFLTKYLESGAYERKDLWNTETCHAIVSRILKNNAEPDMYVKEALSMFGDIPRNVHFLGLNDRLCVHGYRLSTHGHIGVNGSKGLSVKKVDETIGRGIIGHKHAPEQFRDSYVVGTSSRQDLHYTAGSLNAAMGCNAAVYGNGKVQMLPIIGKFW